jgi:hypothetical protein
MVLRHVEFENKVTSLISNAAHATLTQLPILANKYTCGPQQPKISSAKYYCTADIYRPTSTFKGDL